MKSIAQPEEDLYSSLTEGLAPRDEFTRAWLTQAILRMRRELCWLWRKREPIDRLAESLARRSTSLERRRFFAEDPAAHYLDQRIRETKMPLRSRSSRRGSFAWLVRDLDLSRAEIFVVALALAASRDAAAGTLIATLLGDPRLQSPTPGLAQWLWDDPHAFTSLMSPAHPLFVRGILRRVEATSEWNTQLSMPSLIACILEGHPQHSFLELERITEPADKLNTASPNASDLEIELLACRIANAPTGLQIVPISVAFAQDSLEAKRTAPVLRRIASLTGRAIYSIRENVIISASVLEAAGSYCWLHGADLLLPSNGLPRQESWRNTLRPFPIYVFAAANEEGGWSSTNTLPVLNIPAPNYAERRATWEQELAVRKMEADPSMVRECAYRFRLDAPAIADVVTALRRSTSPLTLQRMLAACQQQIGALVGSQATLVVPRFQRHELVLDAERSDQFDEILSAMRSLSRVHADWGTGRAWGDAGISALFAGPPGTGKTMAAEVLAAELQLPLYHVDLSQVVNKYIGETEKNLRKLFDAAEQADIVLFFDEADSLFGQRMQARTSNDRFANMEISYLLERMDRFRGLAILATNRKKDLDEAFLRRLRYVVEFPMPAEAERMAIWKLSIPPQVSMRDVDFALLAHEFALPGGNIRSIVLNACLHAASTEQKPTLNMRAVLNAVDREYEKMGRPLTREQKAQWQAAPIGLAGGARIGALR
jgi:ATPase family associated with various cellular activities (AAA)